MEAVVNTSIPPSPMVPPHEKVGGYALKSSLLLLIDRKFRRNSSK
ncbi:MAG: hypothetical protein ACFFG0_46275 [Candidatus Thorarchaeota archaeon]